MAGQKGFQELTQMNKTIAFLCIIGMIFSASIHLRSEEFDFYGRIESKRKGNVITILFTSPLAEFRRIEQKGDPAGEKITYLIIDSNRIIGSVEILSYEYSGSGKYKIKAVASYTLSNKKFEKLIKAGEDIALAMKKKSVSSEAPFTGPPVQQVYKKTIISEPDSREMILIPEGKFLFGSNSGDRDEYPEQTLNIDEFYLDKYEVSNSDYRKFVDAATAKSPRSWKSKNFDDEFGALPVLVTYYEAEAYAAWAKKRLPTEVEWEKGARGENTDPEVSNVYPWGRKFDPERANCLEFWQDEKIGKSVKERYPKGLLPATSFEKEGASFYGIVNMGGNASEWTSSWYLPYRGNTFKNKKYGNQYKVIRGGAWYETGIKIRVTRRETGGVPSLYSDNIAGFRCVKNVSVLDKQVTE